MELVSRHRVSAFFLVLTLVTIAALLLVRWWLRRSFKRMLESQFDEENELDILPSPGPADRAALEFIRQMRREIWSVPEVELQLSLESLNRRAVDIVRGISSIYHPAAEDPHYEASLIESIELIRRVSQRLLRIATATPFKILGNRRLSDYQRYYQVYRKINDNPLLQLLRRNPHLYRAAKWAMNVKNLGNPLYWAGKELSHEGYFFVLRWFYLTFISQVGKEAMRLYSGRHFRTEEDRDVALVCYRLFDITRAWGGPSPDEWAALVDFVTNHTALEPESKVRILSMCSREKLPAGLKEQKLETKKGLQWYGEGLKRLKECDPEPSGGKKRIIERELAVLE